MEALLWNGVREPKCDWLRNAPAFEVRQVIRRVPSWGRKHLCHLLNCRRDAYAPISLARALHSEGDPAHGDLEQVEEFGLGTPRAPPTFEEAELEEVERVNVRVA